MKENGIPEHVPDIIYFDEDHVTTPGEVCEACSDYERGFWVPASFCPEAKAVMRARYDRRSS
jgi:hypothetical protein